MAMFKTSCPECGDVAVRDYELQMTPAESDGTAIYRFSCPECCLMIQRPASARVVAMLSEGGVPLGSFHAPGRRAPLTEDDLLSFHELLADDGALATFLAEDDEAERPIELPPTSAPTTDNSDGMRPRRWWPRRTP